MTDKDIEQGKCSGRGEPTRKSDGTFIKDKIIPRGAKVVPENTFVYEFTGADRADSAGTYIEHYPGFLKTEKHPKGFCMPCCFAAEGNKPVYKELTQEQKKEEYEMKKKNPKYEYPREIDTDERGNPIMTPIKASNQQATRIKECNQGDAKQPAKKDTTGFDTRVISLDTFPVDPPGRIGFLPISVQRFFNINYAAYTKTHDSSEIKDNTPCLLRYGVEQKQYQSFLGIMADIYAYVKTTKDQQINAMTVDQFKATVLTEEYITLDMFIKYQNGSLITTFRQTKESTHYVDDYRDSAFVKSIDETNQTETDFAEETIAAYKNFIRFLQDPTEHIDHTYLWDILTDSNSRIVPGGINLVILEITKNDPRDNIQLLCPTNPYTSRLFDADKRTLIIIKQDTIEKTKKGQRVVPQYDPVYLYEYKDGADFTKLLKSDKSKKSSVLSIINRIYDVIEGATNRYCRPMRSISDKNQGILSTKIYEFKRNIMVDSLYEILRKSSYEIIYQVMNYQGHTIGLGAKAQDQEPAENQEPVVTVPCFPSAPIDGIPEKMMNDQEIMTTYENTRELLEEISQKTGLPCKPVLRLLDEDDAMIVGILTETNQFVQISPPEYNVMNDTLTTITSGNYVLADETMSRPQQKHDQDSERLENTKMILLESQFYETFRSTIRILLNEYENRNIYNQIENIVKSANKPVDEPIYPGQTYRDQTYREKLKMVTKILRRLTKSDNENALIRFEEIDDDVLMDLSEISTCLGKTDDLPQYCIKDDQTALRIPNKHLISGEDNETIYYGRMADELVRYKRVQLFMMNPKTVLNITDTDYKINDDEFIILQTLLTHEYFEDIKMSTKRYSNTTDYNTAHPAITQRYANEPITLAEQREYIKQDEQKREHEQIKTGLDRCIVSRVPIFSAFWKTVFPKTAEELVFDNKNANDSFCAFLYILQQTKPDVRIDIEFIKTIKQSLWLGQPMGEGPRNPDKMGYKELLDKYPEQIMDLLKTQKLAKWAKTALDRADVEAIINSHEYYLTDLDIWILSRQYSLPIILFSKTTLKYLMETEQDWLMLSGGKNDKFYFLRTPVNLSPKGPIPAYQLVTNSYLLKDMGKINEMVNAAILQRKNTSYIESLNVFLSR
jgi:hypothetical protein